MYIFVENDYLRICKAFFKSAGTGRIRKVLTDNELPTQSISSDDYNRFIHRIFFFTEFNLHKNMKDLNE